VLQRRPNTFAQTNLSPSFFACDKAADHTFGFADEQKLPQFVPQDSIVCSRGMREGSQRDSNDSGISRSTQHISW
jgi:hypothetical protein